MQIALSCGCMVIYSIFNDNYREPWIEWCDIHSTAENWMQRGGILKSAEYIRDRVLEERGASDEV